MSVPWEDLVAYWLGELDEASEARIEERLFDDAETARRLDVVARLSAGIRAVIRSGALQAGLTVAEVDAIERLGARIRTYRVQPDEVVPCTVAQEDFVVVRLCGAFEGIEEVDVIMKGELAGQPPGEVRLQQLFVDHDASEVVLLYPGDRIRALPRSSFHYVVTDHADGRALGSYRLEHTPPA